MTDSQQDTASTATAAPPVSPKLGASVSADLEALRNDMEQARELAADYQRQLAGKSNEVATLKQIFEKTNADLQHLNESITELRNERHRLANEAMRVAALEMKLNRITLERDKLRAELEALRQAPPAPVEDNPLQLEVESLRRSLAAARRSLQARDTELPPRETIDVPFHEEQAPPVTVVPGSAGGERPYRGYRRLR